MLRGLLEILVVLVVLFAWVTGQLDPAQKKLQEVFLDVMGETKLSYGMKSRNGPSTVDICQSLMIRREFDEQEASRGRES